MSGRQRRITHICVTGPESTGKTTLAEHLALLLQTEWVPEASRLHQVEAGRQLDVADVGPIARRHIGLADAAAARVLARGGSHLVLDTDLLSTVVYARHYYGAAPRWVEDAERARRADLYLLCEIDVPWVADGIRDRPARREEIFALFARALARRGARVARIRGSWADRCQAAEEALALVASSLGA